MTSLLLTGFFFFLVLVGLRRPFIWVLLYLYVDIIAPQKVATSILPHFQVSLIAFMLAGAAWVLLDNKADARFTFRQALMGLLLVYCGMTTLSADFPDAAMTKWTWVWKALVFAMFLPLTLRTRLRFEACVLVMVLSVGAIVIDGAIKTVVTGGGYGEMQLFIADNTGLYEGSIISAVSISIVPLIVWLAGHSTVFPRDWRVRLFAFALGGACLLIPVGTQARTGLLCIGLLGLLSLRTAKNPLLYLALAGAVAMAAIPLLPQSYTERMGTIQNHEADRSASTRMAVWAWTLSYAGDHPFGGGFEAYRQNKLHIETKSVTGDAGNASVAVDKLQDAGRAYHSSYFEMLGEQGWPGLFMWLTLQISGLAQMEIIRRRWKKRDGPGERWQAPLASALQQAQMIYLLGSGFVGIAFLPFVLMLIGLQCGLWSYLGRIEKLRVGDTTPAPGSVAMAAGGVPSLRPAARL